MPYPSKKFRQNPFTSLRVIRRTDRQTDRTKNITSFFSGGNNSAVATLEPGTNNSTQLAYQQVLLHWQLSIQYVRSR